MPTQDEDHAAEFKARRPLAQTMREQLRRQPADLELVLSVSETEMLRGARIRTEALVSGVTSASRLTASSTATAVRG